VVQLLEAVRAVGLEPIKMFGALKLHAKHVLLHALPETICLVAARQLLPVCASHVEPKLGPTSVLDPLLPLQEHLRKLARLTLLPQLLMLL
jgi:hypothetical protein